MISRRAALRSAAALGGAAVAGLSAQRMGVLDDGLRAAGIRPHAEPDPRDVELLAHAAADLRALVEHLDALGDDDRGLVGLRSVLTAQLAAVSDDTTVSRTSPSSDDRDAMFSEFVDRVDATSTSFNQGALAAGSLAVTQVLASMSAGLTQISLTVRNSA